MVRPLILLATVFGLLCSGPFCLADSIPALWIGGEDNWFQDARMVWEIPTPDGVRPEDVPHHPNNTATFQFDVDIGESISVVHLNSLKGIGIRPEISNLTIGVDDMLLLEDARQLVINTPSGGVLALGGELVIQDAANGRS